MNNKVLFKDDAKSIIRKGIDLVADAVGSTLGPNGNLVVIGKYSNGKPHVTKDGVTVAKNIHFTDEGLEAGAALLREAACKTVDTVGDATTTSTIVAQAMIDEIDIMLKAGCSARSIKSNIEENTSEVIDLITKASKPIKTADDIRNIATISANNDEAIGSLIADAFSVIGNDGVITVEESGNSETKVTTVSGMQFDRGVVSPYFYTDITKNQAVLDRPYIFITDEKISNFRDIIPIVEAVYQLNRPLLFIAEDFDSEVINNLAVNMNQGLKVCCIKCPSFGEYRVPILNDLAVLTGASIATYDNTIEPKDVTLDMLGEASKVVVTKTNTTIMGGIGDPDLIAKRVESLKTELSTVNSDPQHAEFLEKYYKQRIARLSGGICTIYVGGATELEMKERKDRIDDAVAATTAAIEDGIVAGGGSTYLSIAKLVHNRVIQRGLLAPFERLNKDVPDLNYDMCKTGEGFDVRTGEVVNMFNAGIIDPAKAAKLAFLNAVSVAELYLMTDTLIIPDHED